MGEMLQRTTSFKEIGRHIKINIIIFSVYLTGRWLARNVYDRRSEKVLQGHEENAGQKPHQSNTTSERQFPYYNQCVLYLLIPGYSCHCCSKVELYHIPQTLKLCLTTGLSYSFHFAFDLMSCICGKQSNSSTNLF